MPDYLPRSEGALHSWVTSFSENIAANPEGYGLDDADAQTIVEVVQAYEEAYTRATTPLTRTQPALVARNGARSNMLQVVRRYARAIRANAAVSDTTRAKLGLGAEGKARMRVPAPTTHPMVRIVAIAHCSHELRCSDMDNPDGSWKPAGAIGMQLFCHVGESAPPDPLDARFERFVTRPRQVVHFKPEQIGKTAFYMARWQTARGEAGPWGALASRMISG